MTYKKTFICLVIFISLILRVSSSVSAKVINAVASFTIIADVVQNVGGNHVSVKSLVPVNGDPHNFEPSPADLKNVKTADINFINLDDFEVWFKRLVTATGVNRKPVIVSRGINIHSFNEDGRIINDPHVWNSVANVLVWVDNIESALIQADPQDALAIKASAEAYRQQLKVLNSTIKTKILQVPKERRVLLTSHKAFGYYGSEYGLNFLAPLSYSTDNEASASDIAQLIEQVKSNRIKVYFFEKSNNSRLLIQIANATGAKFGGELYSEALSELNGNASTYIELMMHNTNLIVQALSE
ncbi:periplasmic solute binding family protein [Candidatus Endolissoclinum faulkneri L2]|uniref:Periplasmic solute binding family protein n=1 Tax=Candidatus Endolissoclinum faulkneri L2 TaxID=1193729 RepID=K7YI19_9PROT|nr:zinc ABC transporter substrate-binding protein [Candidatus Endolissoclinum faulkneri]AFX99245.1 periplasmic solute binding family protein [Candidatus Endolissoclinum faulkneri L2]